MLTKYVDCASLNFQATLPDQQNYGVLVAKRAYEIGPEGVPEPRLEQELLTFGDEAYGEINETSLLYPSDVVPYKPRTDIVLAANAHAPGSNPLATWAAGIAIRGAETWERTLTVYGPRQWVPKWRTGTPSGFSKRDRGFAGWQLTEPEPVSHVPIRWEHAWGGALSDPANPGQITVREDNPIGCGWIDPHISNHSQPVTAPQFEWPNQPITDPYGIYTPAGFGPIMPAWLPRRLLGGTFDQAWMDTQRPYWPEDYDFRYHNAAHPAMQINGYLEGGETVLLRNLADGFPECAVKLPGTGMLALLGNMSVRMNLDTLLLDIRSPYPEDWLITTTWRLAIPPVMDYEITLDEVGLTTSRYQNARAAFTPQQVASRLVLDMETSHGE